MPAAYCRQSTVVTVVHSRGSLQDKKLRTSAIGHMGLLKERKNNTVFIICKDFPLRFNLTIIGAYALDISVKYRMPETTTC